MLVANLNDVLVFSAKAMCFCCHCFLCHSAVKTTAIIIAITIATVVYCFFLNFLVCYCHCCALAIPELLPMLCCTSVVVSTITSLLIAASWC